MKGVTSTFQVKGKPVVRQGRKTIGSFFGYKDSQLPKEQSQ